MNTNISRKTKLLQGTSIAMLVSFGAVAANAANVTVVDDLASGLSYTTTATGFESIQSTPINADTVVATITGATVGLTRDGLSTGSTDTLTSNVIAASATGNNFTNTLSSMLLDTDITTDGIAMVGVAINTGTVAIDSIVSSVTDSALVTTITDISTGSVTNSGNAISATTTINHGATLVSGQIPNTYASTTTNGSTFIDGFAQSIEAGPGSVYDSLTNSTASIVATSVQLSQGGVSSASVVNNDITLSLLSTAGQNTIASANLDSNIVSASFAANKATSAVNLSGGENPLFNGTVAVTNVQLFDGNVGSDTAALNSNTTIAGSVAPVSVGVNTFLNSSLSVAGNAVTSAAVGNVSLLNGISLAGGLNVSNAAPGVFSYLDSRSGNFDLSLEAGLSVASAQRTGSAEVSSIASLTENAQITAFVQDLQNSSIDLSGNTISSTSRGNNFSSVIETVSPINSLNSSVLATAMQSVDGVNISGTVANSLIRATVGDVEEYGAEFASISLLGNTVSAAAYGNELSQVVALEGTTLTPGGGLAQLDTEASGRFQQANGKVIVSSLQTNLNTQVLASNTGSMIELRSLDSEGTDDSTLIASGNRQEAVALGALASNSLSLTGTTVGSGAGVLNQQYVDGASSTSAVLVATSRVSTLEDLGDNGASSLSLINNLQRAVAYGASSQNALNVDATTVAMDASGSGSNATAGTVNAGYGLLNSQIMSGDVSATTTAGSVEGIFTEGSFGTGAYSVSVGRDVQDGSAVRNDGNTVLAAAYGTSVASDAVLNIGTLSVSGGTSYAPVANVTNVQSLDASVTARVSVNNAALFTTDIEDDVFGGSSVSTSGNVMQVQALGNNAISNSLTVTSTSIDVFANGAALAGYVNLVEGVSTGAALTVVNTQNASDTSVVLATLRNVGDSQAASVLTTVGSEVSNSSVVSIGNKALATAVANKAANVLDISATSLRTTGALANVQTSGADVSALIGLAGTAPVAGTPAASYTTGGAGTYNQTSFNSLTEVLTIASGGSVTIDISATPAGAPRDSLIALLGVAGFVVTGTSATNNTVGDHDLSFFGTFAQAGGASGTISFTGFDVPGTLGSAGTPTLGGVTIAVGNSIFDSTVRVADNVSAGSAFGNSANNAVNVSATSIAADGNYNTASVAGLNFTADQLLVNKQDLTNASSSTSEVYATYAVDQEINNLIVNSTVDVSGNTQSSTAVGNVGVNALTIAATDMASDPSSALLASSQSSDGTVTVDSGMVVYAPAASLNSSITLNSNSNSALGVVNDVSNRLTVSATNLGSGNSLNAVAGDAFTADNLLVNSQGSTGTLTTTASTSIHNQDLVDTATDGLRSGSVSMNSNTTSAEASANRATNVALVNGAASQGATVALYNDQDSNTAVTANASSAITTTLAGTFISGDPATDLAAINAGSVSINGNTTTSLARGNSASNVVTSSATANYVPLSGASTPGSIAGVVDASAVVLNSQNNTGNVSAFSNSATYAVVLNNSGGTAVTGGSVNVGNNRVDASAYGNTATNRVMLTPLNTGLATGAINSAQFNNGAITAAVTSVSFTINTGGVTNGSSFTAGANAITATAVGNNAISTIATIGR